jgi:diadenosine tetraphosphatase ApaH/serine/threonine PP2A family protein phosphatase
MTHSITFVGHTHIQGGFSQQLHSSHEIRPRYREGKRAESWTLALAPGTRHLINPGSVGQPRDCDWRAAFALFDTERSEITYHRIPYDVSGAQGRVLLAGLPERLAARLGEGR